MVKVDDFHIDLDKKWWVYESGEKVTGSVTLNISAPIVADEIEATFVGAGRVFWVEKELQPPKGLVSIPYSAEQVYFSHSLVLWQAEGRKERSKAGEEEEKAREAAVDNLIKEAASFRLKSSAVAASSAAPSKDKKRLLPAGRYSLPFEFTLPESLPTSFESSAAPAWIRYSVKVSILDQARPKLHRKEYFTILRAADLSLARDAARPILTHLDVPAARRGSLCCVSNVDGGLGLLLSLQKSGYVAGEAIQLTAEVDNASGASLNLKIRMRVEQHCAAFASLPQHRIKETSASLVSTAESRKLSEGRAWRWEPKLLIPALVPSFIELDLMEVSYQLLLELFVGSVTFPVVSKAFPILIGTQPTSAQSYQSPSELRNRGGGNAANNNNETELPPPSYEESVGGHMEEASGAQFLPHYPVYRLQPSHHQPSINPST